MKTFCHSIFPVLFFMSCAGMGMDEGRLHEIVERRLSGDPSGACVAVAYVGTKVAHAFVCADDEKQRPLDAASRFEIGSISKAMQGALAARLVELGRLDIDEPVAALLPPATEVPVFEDQPITVGHLLTHTSGLPRLPAAVTAHMNMLNPYRDLTPDIILEALGQIELEHAPGSAFEYSNFGAMLLTIALTRRAGESFDVLLERELFAPLGMADTSLGGYTVQGHNTFGIPAPSWDFPVNLAGVGGVRASLADMTRWLSVNLDRDQDGPVAALRLAQQELIDASGQSIAWGWLRIVRDSGVMIVHDGGTGGFSSFMAFDPQRGVGAVVLSDTSVVQQGSFGDLAMHLIDENVPLSLPEVSE